MIAASAVAAIAALAFTCLLMPLLRRYALARPNARSSHRVPTPQGAGIAIIAATILAAGAALPFAAGGDARSIAIIFGVVVFIGAVGAIDDIRSVPVIPRLLMQGAAVAAVLWVLSGGARLCPVLPLMVEQTLLLLAGIWFVNLVNFMDGLDWMTVAEVLPVTVALAIIGAIGELPIAPTVAAAALGGAMAGFAPFNRPVARVFLGDVGSLPIGLLLGWCLLELASRQHVAAALMLPLYYLADATITLMRRLARRERVWVAHRSHYYQRATDNGLSVLSVVSHVFVLNVALGALAIASVVAASPLIDAALLAVAAVMVALVLTRFATRSGERQAA